MKYLIASDIHGSALYCRMMLDAFQREKADKLLLLGDILYHGPRNNLPEEYDTKAVAQMLNANRDIILCVRGNCDAEVDQMVLDFPILADYSIIPLGKRMAYATHGHRYNMDCLPPLQAGDILLHGHTHIPAWVEFGENNLYLNPGSVSLPKDGSERGYMVLENALFTWKKLNGEEIHRLTVLS